MPAKKIQWLLFPSYLTIILITFSALAWYTSKEHKKFYLRQVRDDLKTNAFLIREQFLPLIQTNEFETIDHMCKRFGAETQVRITVILPSGKVIGDSQEDPELMDNHASRPEISNALNGTNDSSIRYSDTLKKNMMYMAIPVRKKEHPEEIISVIRTSKLITLIKKVQAGFVMEVFFKGLFLVFLTAIFSYAVSRKISIPLEKIKNGALQFAKGNLNEPLIVQGSQETEALAMSLNKMAYDLNQRIHIITNQRNELEALLSSMQEAVIAVDMQENVLNLNKSAREIFQIKNKNVQGKNLMEVVRIHELKRIVQQTLKEQIRLEKDFEIGYPQKRLFSAHSSIWKNSLGQGLGVVIVISDITHLRRLETIRKDFVANVSHELKTPVTSIKGYVETLLDGAFQDHENCLRFLQIIGRQTDHLSSIIEDLLILSKLEQEQEPDNIVIQETSLSKVIFDAIETCKIKAKEKNIQIYFTPDHNPIIKGIPALLEQAFVNLIDNAIKYSGTQNIYLEIIKSKDKRAIIQVRDEGIGIAKEHLPRLFERFYRIDKARSKKMGGTGLGLAIVKHIVKLHKGKVTVASTPGKGTIFTVFLTAIAHDRG